MSQIRARDTKPEIIVRKLIWKKGYRYSLHRSDLPGRPDLVFSRLKKVIFVHGCFWHKHNCKYFRWPKANATFWKQKIKSNVIRDKKNYSSLAKIGWDYMVLWECETKEKKLESLWLKIHKFLAS